MIYKFFLTSLLIGIVFLGCDSSSSSSSNSNDLSSRSVSIFLNAPVENAIVRDSENQIATYNPSTKQYIFDKTINFPITVTFDQNSFIDVDYDSNKTATDILIPEKITQLQSFCHQINLLTTLYYTNYQDQNISVSNYLDEIYQRYNADICQDPQTNKETAIVLFGTFNYTLNNDLISLDDIEQEVTNTEQFFVENLSNETNTTQYYSAYDTLIELDKHKLQRTDTLHKPTIPTILRKPLVPLATNHTLDVRDIYVDENYVYTASAHDEFAYLPKTLLDRNFLGNGKLDSFGFNLFKQDYNNTTCLYLANSKSGFITFELSSNPPQLQSDISTYKDTTNNQDSNFTNLGIIDISGYVSIGETKRFLGVATLDKGYYLINAKKSFHNCQQIGDINGSDILINQGNGAAISATFRDDGSYVYVANKEKGITRYNLTAPTIAEVGDSKTEFALFNSAQAYKTKLFQNSNELLITTDQGLQVYDITNDDALTYVSSYMLEGAKIDYFPDIDLYQDFVIITDGTQGVKILKLDSSYIPQLCGVEYFSSPTDNYALAKVRSVAYNNGDLYIGLESYGVVKVKFEDLLFEHCK